MRRAEIIAECATSHGGDVKLAVEMVAQAAQAGADTVKFQTYSLDRLNPRDPQADWLRQAHLSKAAHETLMKACEAAGVQFLSTPFDADSLQMLRELGLTRFKVASSESGNDWWRSQIGNDDWLVSLPWGNGGCVSLPDKSKARIAFLTAIPLYPTPLECLSRVTIGHGYSDHCDGTAACLYALARGAKVLEVHFTIPGARQKPWDKSAAQVRELRDFAEQVATMQSGVSQVFRDRWSA